MREVYRLLDVKQSTTTHYHTMENGVIENFNKTFKNVLKKVAAERPKDWHRYLRPRVFAVRDTPQDSTGFTPFELLYGYRVHTPMTLLKRIWTGEEEDSEVKTAYQYVVDLRERIEETCELQKNELSKVQVRNQKYYNRRTREMKLHVGDNVLMLLPTVQNKLTLAWRGPYKVVGTVGEVDYKIEFHHENEQKDVLCNVDIREILNEYQDIFSDVPKVTNLIEHKVQLTETEPMKHKSYLIPYKIQKYIDKEIDDMLAMGVIEGSEAPYALPLVLVLPKKPDNTYRVCINFKELNKITVFDPEPMMSPYDIFPKLSGSQYYSTFDFSKGYCAIPMEEKSNDYTSFITSRGLMIFKVMPFGMVNSGSTYNRMVRKLLTGLMIELC